MSGEFPIDGPFIHHALSNVVEAIEHQSSLPHSKIWLPMFKEMEKISKKISYSEADDISEKEAIEHTEKRIDWMKNMLDDINYHLNERSNNLK